MVDRRIYEIVLFAVQLVYFIIIELIDIENNSN